MSSRYTYLDCLKRKGSAVIKHSKSGSSDPTKLHGMHEIGHIVLGHQSDIGAFVVSLLSLHLSQREPRYDIPQSKKVSTECLSMHKPAVHTP